MPITKGKRLSEGGLSAFANPDLIDMNLLLKEEKLNASDKKKMSNTDYGLPDKKKYPMPDESHVRAAIRFFNHADKEDEAELAKNIKKKIRKFGMSVEVGENNRFYKYFHESNHIYPEYNNVHRIFTEYMDINDRNTRRELLAMDEAEHNSLLTSLTSKLYDHIVKKSMDIDFGDIPKSKGDITKLSSYNDILDVIEILHGILKEYREDSAPVDVIAEALANVKTRKDLFERGFRYNCELPMLMYNTVCLSIITSLSYMIGVSIEFIKAPKDESFSIQLDKAAYVKSKDHILYQSLSKFNKSCQSGDFNKAMETVIEKKVRKFTGVAVAGILAGTVAGIVIVLNIVPILRELTYALYYSRVRISDFFEIQADLLQMNAYNLEHNNTYDAEKKSSIIKKQIAIADRFRAISNKVAIDVKKTDVEANKELQNSDKKYKVDEIEDEASDEDNNSSALF